jgi:hypothetical protein
MQCKELIRDCVHATQIGNILLVLAHADSIVKSMLGRRETLLAMFEVMRRLDATLLLKCLKCLKLLTFDPALLQALQVRARLLASVLASVLPS